MRHESNKPLCHIKLDMCRICDINIYRIEGYAASQEVSLACAASTCVIHKRILVATNNEAKGKPSTCHGSIYVCGIKSEKEEVVDNMDDVMVREKRPPWDANFVKRA